MSWAGRCWKDHAFLSLCGCSAAVANALPKLKDSADLVLDQPRGAGVAALLSQILRAANLSSFLNIAEGG